jgi:cytochrome c
MFLIVAAARAWSGVAWAQSDAQLAVDKGRVDCHGQPPRKNAPTFDALARRHAGARGDTQALHRLADKPRDGSTFGHVDAHEKLGEADALRRVGWISEGAK